MSVSTLSKLLQIKYYTPAVGEEEGGKKLQSTSSSLDHPLQIPPARWQQPGMLGNFERSGHEKGKEKKSVGGMRQRGEEIKPKENDRERGGEEEYERDKSSGGVPG